MVVDVGVVKNYIKPKADSTLYNMRKVDLIEYIRTLEHNYNVAVSFNENQAKYIESLGFNGGVVQEWIPVSERLPELGQPCLCYKKTHGHSEYRLGTYIGATFSENCAAFKSMSHYGCIGATHWMPLPEPPKDGETDG